jgi:DNA polymerase III sliding clamp (beta) subunit (PCNA family)
VQPVLGNVLLDIDFTGRATLTGTNLDQTLQVALQSDGTVGQCGSICLEPKHVLASLKGFAKDCLIEITADKDNGAFMLRVRSGSNYFASPALPAIDFPKLIEDRKIEDYVMTLGAPEISTICDKVAYCAAGFDSASILGGVSIQTTKEDKENNGAQGNFRACATDGSRMVAYDPISHYAPSKAVSLIVPSVAIKHLKAIAKYTGGKGVDTAKMYQSTMAGQKVAVFETRSTILLTRLIQGDYPRYQELFPITNGGYRSFKRLDLLNAVKSIIASNKVNDDRINLMAIAGLMIGSRDGAVRFALNGNSSSHMPICVNANYVKDWLESQSDSEDVTIRVNDSKPLGPLLFCANQADLRSLIMPVQAQDKDNSAWFYKYVVQYKESQRLDNVQAA